MGLFGIDALLNLPPAISILIVSVFVSLVTTLVYKYTTNQKVMKEIKDDVKRMQAEVRSTKEPGRAAQLQKEMMGRSMQQMNSSWKSMLITMVPLFLIFGWMNSNMAYEPIMPGEEFTTTANFAEGTEGFASLEAADGLQLLTNSTQAISNSKAIWRLKPEGEGAYLLSYSFGDEVYAKKVLVTTQQKYEKPVLDKSNGIKKDSRIKSILTGLKPVRPFGSLSLFGWMPGWLATYLIYSIAASILTRKWLKVH
ncbi:DUF106 domain-containing protein [Candidatus Woesearchaeota archaeon]|nr:DUF106 domain-containing protein [Candidatus Woesearchaeota archaeon]